MTEKQQNSKSRTGMLRRFLLTLGLLTFVVATAITYMANRAPSPIIQGWEEYSTERFDSLMANGEPLLVEVYASWCPICLLQHRALETLSSEGYELPIRAIRVDFDKNKDFLDRFDFKHTGTMVLFNEGAETARQTGMTSPEKIIEFLTENGF